jgi:CHAT domain-containing protein
LESSLEQEEEIKNTATSYGPTASRLFVRAEASEERVKSDVSGPRVLHFSSPAILDDTSPMSSFIGLSSATNQQDGFLQLREVLNLQSAADLVVVSGAHRTDDLNGAALVGFCWSWFVAGTPTTLLSRWPVDLPARSALLTKFYSYIKPTSRTSVPKGRALHQSLLSLKRSTAFEHPYYWANFTMIGDAR